MRNAIRSILTCLLCVGCIAATIQAQTIPGSYPIPASYPLGQDFAVTPPDIPDLMSIPGGNDFDAMSPDSWETPNTSIGLSNTGEIVPGISAVDSPRGLNNEAPSTDPAGQPRKSQFFQAGFSRANVQPQPGIERYPLLDSSPSSPITEASSGSGAGNRVPTNGLMNAPNLSGMPANPIQEPMPTRYPDVSIPNQSSGRTPPRLGVYQPIIEHLPPVGNHFDFNCDGCDEPVYVASSFGPCSMGKPFRPDLGHREPVPVRRHLGSVDRGQVYDFEDKKKEYPKLGEILVTGRYFGSVTLLLLEPHFQANTAISVFGPGNGASQVFQFENEAGPRIELGFESRFGPGIELSYWQIDGDSDIASFTSDGVLSGEISSWMLGPKRWTRLTASNLGDRLTALHEIDVEQFGISFFKEVQLPISRINGQFGFQYVKIFQSLEATLEAGGSVYELTHLSDIEAYGPRLVFEYFRPVGHTKAEFVTMFGTSVLFGDRNQLVVNEWDGSTSRIQANEFITAFEFFSGIQFKKNVAEKRAFFGRVGIDYSTWIGGGNSNDPQGDFGLRGFSFSLGYNR